MNTGIRGLPWSLVLMVGACAPSAPAGPPPVRPRPAAAAPRREPAPRPAAEVRLPKALAGYTTCAKYLRVVSCLLPALPAPQRRPLRAAAVAKLKQLVRLRRAPPPKRLSRANRVAADGMVKLMACSQELRAIKARAKRRAPRCVPKPQRDPPALRGLFD